MSKSKNIVWSDGYISTEEFEKRNGHKSGVLWFTGYSGAGKSTLATALQHYLFDLGCQVMVLDGDNIRHGLNKDLSFSADDRQENIRRISEVAKLFQQAGFIVLTAFISPYREDRDNARSIVEPATFCEIFVNADIDTCIQRDPKGLYKKAINKEIDHFTGISDPYEEPLNPEVTVNTSEQSLEESLQVIVDYLIDRGIIKDSDDGPQTTDQGKK